MSAFRLPLGRDGRTKKQLSEVGVQQIARNTRHAEELGFEATDLPLKMPLRADFRGPSGRRQNETSFGEVPRQIS